MINTLRDVLRMLPNISDIALKVVDYLLKITSLEIFTIHL